MIKNARKSSMDPIQEKLRQHKAIWNKEVSTFIDNLINLKKMMNGHPSKFHMERSVIGEPLPKDPTSILGVLADDFAKISTDGNQVIEEQINYSRIRRRKLPPQAKPTPGPVVSPDKQLTGALDDYLLIAEGSNKLTRLLSKLRGPFFGQERRYRSSLLKSCVKLEDLFSEFQFIITRKTKESIFEAEKKLQIIENNIYVLSKTINDYKPEVNKKEAKYSLRKWLGKKRHESGLFSDETSAIRVDIYNSADECKDIINNIMGSLEKEFNISTLSVLLKDLEESTKYIREKLKPLQVGSKGIYQSAPYSRLIGDGIDDPLEGMPKEQREELERRLKFKQIREMARTYYNPKDKSIKEEEAAKAKALDIERKEQEAKALKEEKERKKQEEKELKDLTKPIKAATTDIKALGNILAQKYGIS